MTFPDGLLEIWNFVDALLTDEAYHFGAAFLAGLLAWLLTWIILYVPSCTICLLIQRPIPMVVVFFIRFLCLVAAICFALISHYVLDFGGLWYTMPLGPPLELIY